MVDVTARHEHTLGAQLNMLAAYSACGRLQRLLRGAQLAGRHLVGLAVLLFDLDNGQLLDCLRLSFIFLAISFGLLLGQSSNHLKHVITRRKARVEVTHEVARRDTVHGLLHAQELVTRKQLLEVLQHAVDVAGDSLNLRVNKSLILGCRLDATRHVSCALSWPADTHLYAATRLLTSGATLALLLTASYIDDELGGFRKLDTADS